MKRYTTVIFDLDGTLLDTLQDLTNSVNYALKQYGYPLHTLEEVRYMVGNGVRVLMERAVPTGLSPQEFENVFACFKEHYDIHCNDLTHPYEGIPELLHTLKTRGFHLAIVSNKVDTAVKTLRALYFDDTISVAIGEKEGIRRKPAPDTAITALQELGVSAGDAVYVGDSDVDIQTAANAGMDCISVSWGFRDTAFLQSHGASRIIDHPSQLIEILCKMSPDSETES